MLEDLIRREAYGWHKHPRLTAAQALVLLVIGIGFIVTDISRYAGSFILIGFLAEAFIWTTQVRGKPEPAAPAPRPRFWKEHPTWWLLSSVFLGLMAIAGLLLFLAYDSYIGLVSFGFLGLLVFANFAARAFDAFRSSTARS